MLLLSVLLTYLTSVLYIQVGMYIGTYYLTLKYCLMRLSPRAVVIHPPLPIFGRGLTLESLFPQYDPRPSIQPLSSEP